MEEKEIVIPHRIKMGGNLIHVSIILNVLSAFVLEYTTDLPTFVTSQEGLFAAIITLGLLAFLAFQIGKGKNWARIVFLVIFALESYTSTLVILELFTLSVPCGILAALQELLQITALILLFTGESAVWYREQAAKKTL